MTVRQLIGDLGFAILVALPLAALAKPSPAPHSNNLSAVPELASSDRAAGSERVGILG